MQSSGSAGPMRAARSHVVFIRSTASITGPARTDGQWGVRRTLHSAAGRSHTSGNIKSLIARILGKLQLRDRTQILVVAYETALVQPGLT